MPRSFAAGYFIVVRKKSSNHYGPTLGIIGLRGRIAMEGLQPMQALVDMK